MEGFPELGLCLATRSQIISRKIAAIFRQHLLDHDVSLSQLNVLFKLADEYPARITQSQLGKSLSLERSTVSRDLHRLMDRGYVEKREKGISPHLLLTRKGRRFVERLVPDWKEAQNEVAGLLGSAGIYYLDAVIEKLDSGETEA